MSYSVVAVPRRSHSKNLARKRGKTRPKKKRAVRGKIKPTSLFKADALFSAKIRARDVHCLFPGCTRTDQLTCSHYYSRAIKNTRFDENNCITLCRTHHYWDKMLGFEFQKQREEEHGWDGRYTLFMKKRLGDEEWEALKMRSKESVSQKKAIDSFLLSLKDIQ